MESLKRTYLLLLGAIFLLASGTVTAHDGPKGDPSPAADKVQDAETSTNTIDLWVANLGSQSFQTRRESFVELWKTGRPALQAVQAAMQSADRQQAEAAATLEVLIRLNVVADNPDETADLLSELTNAPELALVKLCQRGYWNVAEQLLEMNSELLNSFRSSASAYARINALIDEAHEQDQVNLAWPVVRMILPYQQALWIARRQNLEPPPINQDDPQQLAWMHFLRNDFDSVLATNAPASLKADFAVRSFNWEAFKNPELMIGLVGRRETAGQRAARAVMLEFAGDLDGSEELWKSVLPTPDPANVEVAKDASDAQSNTSDEEDPDQADAKAAKQLITQQIKTDRQTLDALTQLAVDPTVLQKVLVAMLLSGRSQAVQDFILEMSPERAWLLCLIRGDREAALASVGLASDLSNFDAWLQKRRRTLHSQSQMSDGETFRTTIMVANDLQGLGKIEEANQVLEMLVTVCRTARQRSEAYWETFAMSMARAEARHRFLEIFADNYERLDNRVSEAILAQMYPEMGLTVAVLLATAPEIHNEASKPSKWAAIEQLYCHNRLAFEPQGSKTVIAWLRRARNKLSEDSELSGPQLSELAKLAEGLGQGDLALEFARESGLGSSELWAFAGRMLQQRGDLNNALEYFSAIRQTDSSHQESIIDEANTLLMLGRVTEAQALERSRWMRPLLVNGASSWYSVAQRLNDEKRYELAKEYIEPSFLLAGIEEAQGAVFADPRFIGITVTYWQTAEELKDVELSADLHRVGLATFLSGQSTRSHPPNIYASFAARERTRRAILAAKRGDMDDFNRHAKVAVDLQPQGIELVEDTYHELIASGNEETAKSLLQQFEERLVKHLEKWPADATTHNNLAWMYARCGVKLNEALEHSTRAVELAPHSAVLLDTLAEVQFRLGQFSAAVASMERCIQLDPRDPHFRRQLDRFLKAQLEQRRSSN